MSTLLDSDGIRSNLMNYQMIQISAKTICKWTFLDRPTAIQNQLLS